MAKDIIVTCGSWTMPFHRLKSAFAVCGWAELPIYHEPEVEVLYHNNIRLVWQLRGLKELNPSKYSPLISLLQLCGSAQSTDPRDRVFALVGISEKAETPGFEPDYRETAEEAYM